jgi:hypothetical protein
MRRSRRFRTLLLTFPRKWFLAKGHLSYVGLSMPINEVLCVQLNTVRLNGVCALDLIRHLVDNVQDDQFEMLEK